MPLPRSQFMDTAAYVYDCIPLPLSKEDGPPGKQAVIGGTTKNHMVFKDTPQARRHFKKLLKKANAELDAG